MMLHQELAYPRSSRLLDLVEEEEVEVLRQIAPSGPSRQLMVSVLEDPEEGPQG